MLSLLIASAAVVATLADEMQAIAKLPGEPSIVSAAGLTATGDPVLTLENRSAFDPQSRKRRVVLLGLGTNGPAKVSSLLRWLKMSAPRKVRDQWNASAIPSADSIPDDKVIDRWVEFQAADFLMLIGDRDGRVPFLGHPNYSGAIGLPVDDKELQRLLIDSLEGAHEEPDREMAARVTRDPLAIAKLLAATYPGEPSISYIPALSWSNTLKLAAMTNDAALKAKVDQQTQPWRSGGKELFGNRIQLTSVAGSLVFADLVKSGDESSRALAIKGAEAASKVKEGDLYEYGGGWTDDMFMASVILARTAVLPGRLGDIDLAAKMLIAYAGRLQRPDGIFIHAVNGPVAWGRGNGFAALGLMEALTAMPSNHSLREKVLDIYKRQMEALRAQQAPDGMWREVIDEPGSYREESATAIIMTAMARGVRLGWLDRSYATVVQRAWRALSAHIAEDGTVIDVCTSTGSGPTKKYYLDRAAITGADDRGGAMALMAAMEMIGF